MVDNSLVALIILSLFLGCGCWLFFIWAVKKGEFDDIERPKHRMLDDDFPASEGEDKSGGSSTPQKEKL